MKFLFIGDPKRADAHINLAIAHKQAGNMTGSAYHWKQASSQLLVA